MEGAIRKEANIHKRSDIQTSQIQQSNGTEERWLTGRDSAIGGEFGDGHVGVREQV